ncbi:MAG: hypothetical protein RR804_01285 [Massilia sp.]
MPTIPTSTSRGQSALIGAVFGAAALLASCSNNADLDAANKKLQAANTRIVALETKLAETAPRVPSAQAANVSTTPGAADSSQSTEVKNKAGKQWRYEAVEEPMTGKTQYTATVSSSNTVNLSFPYNDEQRGSLTLRTHPQYGKDVIFGMEKGQILCPSYKGCQVQVRFDEGKPIRFQASGAADHSTEYVFIDDYTGFVSQLKKAKRVRVAVEIYQNGSPAFEFDISGFDTAKYQPKT